ncbi:MAG TPA: cyclodeaminase/cyclohydrolase family protein [Chloroflexota bacterium]|nr:cyclodeaminase/cyclohydrolase family protein [Chloroflexota bacterium]
MDTSERLAGLTIADFTGRLASDQPTPGGGAAAGLTASLAAALVAMVGRHTLGRQRYANVQRRVAEIVAEADDLRTACQALMEADSAAFDLVSAAYKLPKQDLRRPAQIQAGLRQATDVPLESMRQCHRIQVLASEIGRIGNQTLVGDAITAGLLARAAAQASAVNVRSNCAALDDRAYAEASLAEMASLVGDPG